MALILLLLAVVVIIAGPISINNDNKDWEFMSLLLA
jgi:hypothetical protein